MLTPQQRAEIETAIRKMMGELQEKIVEYKELTKPIPPENAIGRVSRMDAINNKSVNEAALRQSEAKFQRLQLALKKIDEPYFGICTKCGNPIPMGRVMLVPGATTCVPCAS